jgi:hypothetical protein
MLLAVFLAVLAMAVLDLRRSSGGGNFRACVWFAAAVVAAALPIGAILPAGSLSHVGVVPSFDVLRPCVAPMHSPSRHAIVPFVLLRVLFPIAVVAFISRDPPAPRPRFLLGFAVALATTVLAFASVRAVRGGADPGSFRACGALTPETGSDATQVRWLLRRLMREPKQEVIAWRDLPKLPRPPWVWSEIAVTIGGEPWVLRKRGARVVAEPDDLRRADRPLPALHFASVPSMATSNGAMVLLDHRPEGKLYAVRVGQPAQFNEVAPLLRPPWWPIAFLVLSLAVTLVTLLRSRPKRLLGVFAPYRTAPDDAPAVSAMPAFCAFLLIEASLTAMHVLLPYL